MKSCRVRTTTSSDASATTIQPAVVSSTRPAENKPALTTIQMSAATTSDTFQKLFSQTASLKTQEKTVADQVTTSQQTPLEQNKLAATPPQQQMSNEKLGAQKTLLQKLVGDHMPEVLSSQENFSKQITQFPTAQMQKTMQQGMQQIQQAMQVPPPMQTFMQQSFPVQQQQMMFQPQMQAQRMNNMMMPNNMMMSSKMMTMQAQPLGFMPAFQPQFPNQIIMKPLSSQQQIKSDKSISSTPSPLMETTTTTTSTTTTMTTTTTTSAPALVELKVNSCSVITH